MRGWPDCPKCEGTGRYEHRGQVVKCRELKPCGVCHRVMGIEATQGNDPAHASCASKDPKPSRFYPAAPHAAHGFTWGGRAQ